jgi:hypothetical protein
MERMRKLLWWRVGGAVFFVVIAGIALESAGQDRHGYEAFNGLGLALLGVLYFLHPVEVRFMRPFRESVRVIKEAAVGPAPLRLTLMGLFIACELLSIVFRFLHI